MFWQNNPNSSTTRRWAFFLLGIGGCFFGNTVFAQSLSLSLSETFLQTYLTAEYHGQDVSTENDQSFGFDKVRLQLKKGRMSITTDFWYKKFFTKAKATPVIDVIGNLKASFSVIYLPKKKRVMLAKSSIEHLKLTKGGALKPLLEPLLQTALDRIIVWEKIDQLVLGTSLKIPIKSVQIDLHEQNVIAHLNQPSQIPPELLAEMFAIAVNESTLNAALAANASEIFSNAIGIVKNEAGVRYEIKLSGEPFLDIYPGPSIQPGETRLALPLLLNPIAEDRAKGTAIPLKIILQVVPHLEGKGRQVSINLELKPDFELKSAEFSLKEQPWIEAALQEYLLQIRTLLAQLKVALPPIPFIPKAQQMQLSKITLDNNQMGLGGTLVE